ncbi:MAG: polyphosphate:AMP phosphotransferase [Acidobacteria bacterium]|nr:polyphosphate:AMP phosphotransferase [Acidobacteriota bacterium]
MFESAEIGHSISRKEWKREAPLLRQKLLAAQYRLLEGGTTPVIVLVNGVDGSGKGETVNLLNEWMDPRHIRTEAFGGMTAEDRARPEMWRFWQVLPAKGRIGILFGSWYTDPILARVMGHEKKGRFAQRLERIRALERMLVAEGAVVVKLWFHLTEKEVRKRFRALEKDETTSWRVTKDDWKRLEHNAEFVKVCEVALRRTSTGEAPWLVVDGRDPAYRSLTAGRALLDAMIERLDGKAPEPPRPAPVPPPPLDGRTLLSTLSEKDATRVLSRKRYEEKLPVLQARLNRLTRDPRLSSRSLVVVFEGMDAAGKGSTIRRVTQALDARHYRVVPIAAPTEEERAQPYLWRFWRHIPRHGHAVLFDRSWYGRVLVERVEGFCSTASWMRAYDEINEFEEQLAEGGAVVAKLWMAVSPEEQLRRFEERKKTPHKQFKLTDEDWRNRTKAPLYERAVGDMIDRTSTDVAPWKVIASDDKLFSRIAVLEHLTERLEGALSRERKKR